MLRLTPDDEGQSAYGGGAVSRALLGRAGSQGGSDTRLRRLSLNSP